MTEPTNFYTAKDCRGSTTKEPVAFRKPTHVAVPVFQVYARGLHRKGAVFLDARDIHGRRVGRFDALLELAPMPDYSGYRMVTEFGHFQDDGQRLLYVPAEVL